MLVNKSKVALTFQLLFCKILVNSRTESFHFVQQLRGTWWFKVSVRMVKTNQTVNFPGGEEVVCAINIKIRYKKLPWMLCDFFFNLTQRKGNCTWQYLWTAGWRRIRRCWKRNTKGRVQVDAFEAVAGTIRVTVAMIRKGTQLRRLKINAPALDLVVQRWNGWSNSRFLRLREQIWGWWRAWSCNCSGTTHFS